MTSSSNASAYLHAIYVLSEMFINQAFGFEVLKKRLPIASPFYIELLRRPSRDGFPVVLGPLGGRGADPLAIISYIIIVI
jgi:hypothetical protein